MITPIKHWRYYLRYVGLGLIVASIITLMSGCQNTDTAFNENSSGEDLFGILENLKNTEEPGYEGYVLQSFSECEEEAKNIIPEELWLVQNVDDPDIYPNYNPSSHSLVYQNYWKPWKGETRNIGWFPIEWVTKGQGHIYYPTWSGEGDIEPISYERTYEDRIINFSFLPVLDMIYHGRTEVTQDGDPVGGYGIGVVSLFEIKDYGFQGCEFYIEEND